MDLDEIRQLMASFAASDLSELQLTRGDWTLHLVRAPDGTAAVAGPAPRARRDRRNHPAPVTRPAANHVGMVRAPLAGLVYLSAAPDALPFVSVGSKVATGDTVAVIEAMKVFNEIRAEQGGIVEAISVTSGDEVEAGQLILRIGGSAHV